MTKPWRVNEDTSDIVRAPESRESLYERIELLEEQVAKYKGLFEKAQGMLDIDEIKRLRSLCCKYAEQIRQLEEMRGIKWNPTPTDTPIM